MRCVMRRVAGGILAAAALAPALAACGAPAASAADPDQLVLYNGQHEQTTQALVNAFEQQTGIKVTVRSDDEAVLAQQIMQEGPRSPADVFYTENTPALVKLAENNLLAPVSAATRAAVPAADSAAGWVGVSARFSVLEYNTGQLTVSRLPTSIMDLANPRWAGKLGIAPGETDFQPIITSIADTYGQAAALKWLNGVKSNAGSHIYPDNETLTAQVNAGQVELALINQYYWYRLRSSGTVMQSALQTLASGDPGYVEDVSGAAVLASSAHKPAAQKFLAFLVSAQGQRIIAQSDSFEYPLRPGVAAHAGLPPLASLRPDAADTPARLGDGSQALTLLQEAQLG